MELKRLFRSFLEVLSSLVIVVLAICLGYFVRDIWNDYQAGKTNDRVYSTNINYYRHPTIAICFEPKINETLLKRRYNRTINDLSIQQQGIPMVNLTVPIKTLLDEVDFKLGRDFFLNLMLSGHESNHNYIYAKINEVYDYKDTDMVKVVEVPTLFYGTCTIIRISDKLKGSVQLTNLIELQFNSNNQNALPLVNVFFTSDENYHGAAWRLWMEGEVYAITIDPKEKLDYNIDLKQQIRKRLANVGYCNSDTNYYKCMAKRY